MKITIIGLGGVGSIVANSISRYLYHLESFSEITLIDGDAYELKNNERQLFSGYGNKATIKEKELSRMFGSKIKFMSYPVFINNTNINLIESGDIIFLSVDNHKTRKTVNDFCKTLKNVILISGGNEYTDGNVQIYVRKEGKDITPGIDQFHPEISNPADKSPEELSCEELAQTSSPQLFFMNQMVASYMCAAFYNCINNRYHSEIYIDIEAMNSDSKIRKVI